MTTAAAGRRLVLGIGPGSGLRLSEAQFTMQVIGSEKRPGVAPLLGYSLAYHTHDSRMSAYGFPDWVLIRPDGPRPRTVFLELKAWNGRPTREQQEWIEALWAAGQEAACFWPDQFDELVAWLR